MQGYCIHNIKTMAPSRGIALVSLFLCFPITKSTCGCKERKKEIILMFCSLVRLEGSSLIKYLLFDIT